MLWGRGRGGWRGVDGMNEELNDKFQKSPFVAKIPYKLNSLIVYTYNEVNFEVVLLKNYCLHFEAERFLFYFQWVLLSISVVFIVVRHLLTGRGCKKMS